MSTYTITTRSGAVITAEVLGQDITITQDGHVAGRGRVVRGRGGPRIEDCSARLGAADGSETEEAYVAIERVIA